MSWMRRYYSNHIDSADTFTLSNSIAGDKNYEKNRYLSYYFSSHERYISYAYLEKVTYRLADSGRANNVNPGNPS